MPAKHIWTADELDVLNRMGSHYRNGWDAIALVIGVTRNCVIGKARKDPALMQRRLMSRTSRYPQHECEDPDRAPLPPGSPVSWGAITVGTLLEGSAYEYVCPVFGVRRVVDGQSGL